jgi:hypothetical protein
MKPILIAGFALLVGAVGWLALRQQRLERRIDVLRIENARLSEELAQKPNLSPEQFRAASQRLEKAGVFIDAVENRLTNASALLKQLQSASQDLGGSSRRRPASGAGSRADYPPPLSTPPGFVEGPPRPAVSSHGPDGQLLQRYWGPEQLVGPPDTHAAGDMPTAWAPLSSRGGRDEWLQVNYDRAVDISEIRVRETYNPGAIAKLAAVLPDGQEVVIWEGVTPPTEAPADTGFAAPAGLQAQSVKIYLDRTRAPGWNEIDAVELVGRDGTRQWASSAAASTSYADQTRR